MTEILNDRRRALRVQLRTYGDLSTADGGCSAHLLDLSESGALVAVLEPHQLTAGEAVTIRVELPEEGEVRMEGHVAHVKEHLLGLDCTPATDEDARKVESLVDRLAQQI